MFKLTRMLSPDPVDGGAGTPPANATPPVSGEVQAVTASTPATQSPVPSGEGQPTEKPAESKLFTQADVDRIAGERAKRARETQLKDLGFESAEAARSAARIAHEAAEAQKSDAERIAELKRQKADADARAQAANLRAAVVAQAAGRFVDADAAYRLSDLSGVTPNDDGTFTGLDEALDALAQARPYLINQPGRPPHPTVGPAAPKGKPVGRSEADRRAEYFGGGDKNRFWRGGGVVMKEE